MTNKKRRSRWKRLPIPTEVVNQLTDKNIPEISRVELAEKIRKQYSYSQADMFPYLNCSPTHYCRHLKILQTGNMMLRQMVQDGVGVSTACKLLADPVHIQNYQHYPKLEQVERVSDEIMYESKRYILYRYKDELCLRIFPLRSSETFCWLDDKPIVIKTILDLLNNGCTICTNMNLLDNHGNNIGSLQHHLLAALCDKPLSAVRDSIVRFRQKTHDKNTYNLRSINLYCKGITRHSHPDIFGGNMIYKSKKQLQVRNPNTGIVSTTDYADWLYNLLQSKTDSLRFHARDNRLCIPIDQKYEYLYHIIMTVELYGVPVDEKDLREKIDNFRKKYLDKDKTVDHLNNDPYDCRLLNLMIMTRQHNTQKQSLDKQIDELGLPYFCWAERYDDISVRLRAGYVSPLKMPTYIIDGIYTIPDYLKKMEDFICAAKEEVMIYDELRHREENNGS